MYYNEYINNGQEVNALYNNRIRAVCKEKKIPLKVLGDKVGKSKQYINELCNGNIKLSYDMAVKIADALNSTTDEIFLSEKYTKNGQYFDTG